MTSAQFKNCSRISFLISTSRLLLFVFNTMALIVNNLSVVHFILISISIFPSSLSIILKYPTIINFGDSNSDTGNLISAGIESVNPPYGQTYFNFPSGRYCDGRLIVDCLCINDVGFHWNMSFKFYSHNNCFWYVFCVVQWMPWTCHF